MTGFSTSMPTEMRRRRVPTDVKNKSAAGGPATALLGAAGNVVPCRKPLKIVILKPDKSPMYRDMRGEEPLAYENLRFFAEPVLERSERLRMTSIKFSTEQNDL